MDMLPASKSTLKRKHEEYYDPNYSEHHQFEHDVIATSNELPNDGNNKITNKNSNEIVDVPKISTASHKKTSHAVEDAQSIPTKPTGEERLQRIRDIISREFQCEILRKEQELELVDERLDEAKHLLDKLRYAIVAEYYQKQEVPLTQADTIKLRANCNTENTLFDKDYAGPQKQIHPSLRSVLGKRPHALSELLRPARAAAKNAKRTIHERSAAQKRKEKHLKKMIREEGIVIDHSKQEVIATGGSATQDVLATVVSCTKEVKSQNKTTSKNELNTLALNAARVNNKKSHQIVVGNTSKYIGHENDIANVLDQKTLNGQILSHKWLVYVQTKDTNKSLEQFVKKIRFTLHHSYRPNDVIDITSPPYQISRRGWGEFPLRIQLFFQDYLKQKPVQFIHNIVLDKTLSGKQTMGAETILEIWLRTKEIEEEDVEEVKTIVENKSIASPKISILLNSPSIGMPPPSSSHSQTPTSHRKQRYISFTQNKDELEDNLFNFLNKIDETPTSYCADIEKIQPTVLVKDLLSSPVTSTLRQTPTRSTFNNLLKVQIENKLPGKLFSSPKSSDNNFIQNDDITIKTNLVTTPKRIPPLGSRAVRAITPVIENLNNTSIISTTESTKIDSKFNSIHMVSVPKSMPTISSSSIIMKPLIATTIPATAAQIIIPTNTVAPNSTSNFTTINTKSLAAITTVSTPMLSTIKHSKPVMICLPNNSNNTNNSVKLLPDSSINNNLKHPIVLGANNKIVATTSNLIIPKVSMATTVSATNVDHTKKILQKRYVKVIDKDGNVKLLQMFVATSPQQVNSVASNIAVSGNFVITNSKANAVPVSCALTPLVATAASTLTTINVQQNSTTGITTDITKLTTTTQSTKPIMTPMAGKIICLQTQNQLKPQISNINNNKILTKTLPTSNSLTTTTLNQLSAIQSTLTSTTTTTASSSSSSLSFKPLILPNKSKNIVFQKEGKLYIIDPLQMKIKQEQKKQVSLLKPQISLLKQQLNNIKNPTTTNHEHQIHEPPLKNDIIYNLQLQNCLEQKFLTAHFTDIISAVEFLLRRLPLIDDKNIITENFPFICKSQKEFKASKTFKQRAYEWLRSKYISRIIRKHKDLQQLDFWTTREIIIFARQYAYTPPMKMLLNDYDNNDNDIISNEPKFFTKLVKNELQHEQQTQYETLTTQLPISSWLDQMLIKLQEHETEVDDNRIIDIVGNADDMNIKCNVKYQNDEIINKIKQPKLYLPPPSHLDNATQLVREICSNIPSIIRLQNEHICDGVVFPKVETILANSLQLFIENILRRTIAMKIQQKQIVGNHHQVVTNDLIINPKDIGMMLSQYSEFDFLTNKHLGVVKANNIDVIEQENNNTQQI